MYKLRLRLRGSVYKFLGFDFRDQADGSFIVVFNHVGRTKRMVWNTLTGCVPRTEDPASEKFRISYHTTGQINFHGVSAKAAFWQPIYDLTDAFDIAYISVPAIELLEEIEEKSTDYIIGLPDDMVGRATFVLSMLPPGYEVDFTPLALVNYSPFFKFSVAFGALPITIAPGSEDAFIRVTPFAGPRMPNFPTKHEAKIRFHQKKAGVGPGPVTSFQPNEGIYRIIFPVPMRGPPKVKVRFVDPEVTADILLTTESEVRFRAKGAVLGRHQPLPIKSYELDAEL
jgi:hypothetical protein